jgi:hypothetical protein
MAQVLSSTDLLLLQLDQAFDGKAWHGPTLRGSLRGLTAKESAAGNSSLSGHTIAEIALHCAYWKYVARRRLLNLPKGSFAFPGSNWFTLPHPLTQGDWRKILQVLEQEHQALREAVQNYPPARLSWVPPKSKVNQATLLVGIAHHDVYHAGQIRLLKKKLSKG